MSLSAGFGRIISHDLTNHYNYYDRNIKETNRLDIFKDLIGNGLYFISRTALRTAVVAFRLLNIFIPRIFADSDRPPLLDRIKLFALSTLRLLTPLAQIPLSCVGALIKSVGPSKSLQKKGVNLLQLSHEFDNYFDQLELQIAKEYDEIPNSDILMGKLFFPKFMPFSRHSMATSIFKRDTNGVRSLIRKGYPTKSLLHLATANNQLDIAKLLVDSGINYFSKNKKGETPLQLSTNLQITKLLTDKIKQHTEALEGVIKKLCSKEQKITLPDEIGSFIRTFLR